MDTERKVSQLDADIHEIYGMVKDLTESVAVLRRSGSELRGMVHRQGNRLDALEANVAQLADDVAELKADVAGVKGDVAGLKTEMATVNTKLDRVLELLTARPPGAGPYDRG